MIIKPIVILCVISYCIYVVAITVAGIEATNQISIHQKRLEKSLSKRGK